MKKVKVFGLWRRHFPPPSLPPPFFVRLSATDQMVSNSSHEEMIGNRRYFLQHHLSQSYLCLLCTHTHTQKLSHKLMSPRSEADDNAVGCSAHGYSNTQNIFVAVDLQTGGHTHICPTNDFFRVDVCRCIKSLKRDLNVAEPTSLNIICRLSWRQREENEEEIFKTVERRILFKINRCLVVGRKYDGKVDFIKLNREIIVCVCWMVDLHYNQKLFMVANTCTRISIESPHCRFTKIVTVDWQK